MSDPSLEALAARVRVLIDTVVTTEAPADALADATALVDRATAALAPFVPVPPPPRYPSAPTSWEIAHLMPYDPVMGPRSPLAPPVLITTLEHGVEGRVCFGTPYEGPPGCVHGGVIASVFDQVLNAANLLAGATGPTVSLALRYRRATPLHRDLVFEARQEQVVDKRITTRGRLLAGDEVTVEAEGVFAHIPLDRIMRLRDP